MITYLKQVILEKNEITWHCHEKVKMNNLFYFISSLSSLWAQLTGGSAFLLVSLETRSGEWILFKTLPVFDTEGNVV